jgi:hypothetical protein
MSCIMVTVRGWGSFAGTTKHVTIEGRGSLSGKHDVYFIFGLGCWLATGVQH